MICFAFFLWSLYATAVPLTRALQGVFVWGKKVDKMGEGGKGKLSVQKTVISNEIECYLCCGRFLKHKHAKEGAKL